MDMDHMYAFGISCIVVMQDVFKDVGWYFELVNALATPSFSLDILFPFVATFDSVFAAEVCLCCAFGGWLNSIMKWWFFEDRPYWWVQETDYYDKSNRPKLRQTSQTCESGPGCPSGHSEVAAMVLMLILMWTLHVMNDRRYYVWWWKWVAVPLLLWILGSVMMARMYVGSHFPHQVVFGALLGAFLAPAICLYVVDPLVYRTGIHEYRCFSYARFWHLVSVFISIGISLFTYAAYEIAGWDTARTRKLALKWCENPKALKNWKRPMFSLALNTGHMFGWVMAISPEAANYRHYSCERSLELAIIATGILMYFHNYLKKQNTIKTEPIFYFLTFVFAAIKPFLLLRVVPCIAKFPYRNQIRAHSPANPATPTQSHKVKTN